MATYEKALGYTPIVEGPNNIRTTFSLIERPVYGSSRIAVNAEPIVLTVQNSNTNEGPALTTYGSPEILSHTNGFKQFELTNHLGNVMAVVSDKRTPIITGSEITGYTPELLIAKDYYPFGMEMSGRYTGVGNEDPDNKYRFGFNGKEKDDEWNGQTGAMYDYGFRIYDPRIGRFLSVDPLAKSYSELSTYQYASNTPVWAIDLDGLEAYFTTDGKFDRWGEEKGKDAPVIIVKNAGDVNGVTLKNNSTDYKGKDITVQQFLKRSQRVYAEGGRNIKTAPYYAHAQDNKRTNNGGRESDNYSSMTYKDFDSYSKYNSYTEWNNKRGVGYEDLSGLNKLNGANYAIAAVSYLLQGKSTDPTNGANQWRGAGENEYVPETTVLWTDQWETDMKAAKTDPKILEKYGLKGVCVENYTILKSNGRAHLFFKTTKTS